MKKVVFTLLLISACHAFSYGQRIMGANCDTMPPDRYALYFSNLYIHALGLTVEQEQKTYTALYHKKKILDSLGINKITVSYDELWNINKSVEKLFKVILSRSQYQQYEDLQRMDLMKTEKRERE